MSKRTPTKSKQGVVATGAAATGAASLGAMAMGAMALGALAVGALAIGRLTVGRARLRRVEIGELTVGRLDLRSVAAAGETMAVARPRTPPGRGDELERFLRARLASAETPAFLARRSPSDPDQFLLSATEADAPGLDAVLRAAADQGLVLTPTEDPVEVYRAL